MFLSLPTIVKDLNGEAQEDLIKNEEDLEKMKENNLKNNLFESVIDVGSGYLLAVAIQLLIFPLFGLYPTILDSMGIALIFTVISMIRSWVWRCYFRRKHIIRSH